VLQEIRAIRIHLPTGRQIDLRSDQVKAVTIDRRQLEQELLVNARQAGADVCFNTKAMNAQDGTLHVQSSNEDLHIRTSVIIGADGPRSRVASWFSLAQPVHFVAAAQVELEDVSPHMDRVDFFIGSEIAPGFFGWSVPAEAGIMRVGLGVLPPHVPTAFLDRFLAHYFPTARIRSRSAGWIPLGPAPQTTAQGVLLVGDAAGHVKPLSGGGLYTGGSCARIAGEIAAQIARSAARIAGEVAARISTRSSARIAGSNDIAADLYTAYALRCAEIIGKEQAFGQSMRIHISKLGDEDIEAAAIALSDRQLLQFLADEADIDLFHQLPDRLASEPRLWSTLLRIVPLLGALTD
jgi:flavin-dependent dehydrogenase